MFVECFHTCSHKYPSAKKWPLFVMKVGFSEPLYFEQSSQPIRMVVGNSRQIQRPHNINNGWISVVSLSIKSVWNTGCSHLYKSIKLSYRHPKTPLRGSEALSMYPKPSFFFLERMMRERSSSLEDDPIFPPFSECPVNFFPPVFLLESCVVARVSSFDPKHFAFLGFFLYAFTV